MDATTIFFLVFGLVFTFVIPGFLVVETLAGDLEGFVKLPLYFILSVLVSSYEVYLISLVLGFSRESIILAAVVFVPWIFVVRRKVNLVKFYPKGHGWAVAAAVAVWVVFLVVLRAGIFTPWQDSRVMAGVNWQDTAMHLGIIESIAAGNFPPQAPYFSGVPLSYYYFSDFHTAILQRLVGGFSPQILAIDNPFFVFTFFLAVYALGYYLFKKRSVALIGAVVAIFNGNFMVVRFVEDVGRASGRVKAIVDILTRNGYTMEYGRLMQMTPMVDYFLQNRPMMVGLPAAVMAVVLALVGLQERKRRALFLAGLIVGMLVRFQLFAFGVGALMTGILIALFLKGRTNSEIVKDGIALAAPVVIFGLLIVGGHVEGRSVVRVMLDSFRFGPWDNKANPGWFGAFYIANFGIPFLISLGYLGYVAADWRRKLSWEVGFLGIWFGLMFVIPHVVSFTIYEPDMFKFFYFMAVPMGLLAAVFLAKLIGAGRGGLIIGLVILFVLSSTALLVLASNYLNKSVAYSKEDLTTGLWIRQETPVNSVFVTYPSVHSAVVEIGGRLRVLSYINWPYSHGYNMGKDSVFGRLADIKIIYSPETGIGEFKDLMAKYRVDYLYYGSEEKSNYPGAALALANNKLLKQVYDKGGAVIYRYTGR